MAHGFLDAMQRKMKTASLRRLADHIDKRWSPPSGSSDRGV
jgi:hypothetical protein